MMFVRLEACSENIHDAKITLGQMWGDPNYKFSEYHYYTFVMRGLVSRPYPTTTAIPADKLSEGER